MTPESSYRSGGRPDDGFPRLLRAAWAGFRSSRRLVLTMVASVLVTVSLGLLVAGGARSTCVTWRGDGPCPAPLTGPDGTAVNDKYYFVHQPLKGDGTITARVSDLTGQMRMPDVVPGVRNVKQGVVPWGKAGLLIRPTLEQGGPYAAVLLTGGHGVRMQHNFTHDTPGSPVRGTRWLRLTRTGDTITGYESGDGQTWSRVGTAELAGLPETVEIGLFATSPGVLWGSAQAFAQATATFDQIQLQGANGTWRHDDVGVTLGPDGKTPHHPGGAAAGPGGKLVVTGGGDIGPATMQGGLRADLTLLGGAAGLTLVLAAASMYGTPTHPRTRTLTGRSASHLPGDRPPGERPSAEQQPGERPSTARLPGERPSSEHSPTANLPGDRPPAERPSSEHSLEGRLSGERSSGRPPSETPAARTSAELAAMSRPPAGPHPVRLLVAKAVVVGVVAFVAGLVTAGIVVPAGLALLRAHQNPIQPITLVTELRVIAGFAALTAAVAVLALGLAALVGRAVVAAVPAVALVVLPYLLAVAGLAPWLLAVTPAAGFAITQSVPTFEHVDVVLSPLGGYYPLPPWAGLAVTCAYAALALGAAVIAHRRKAMR